ncbi:hypothetical protein [Mastigocoleus sp. MO_188.B34]|uniref:hypothetical protein n=1 Tax=Mastigocoleus sp. MO_188.B34 TaxID=3036635 RepID=UPI002620CFA1|nr:hypothetical protein [Mastigocoleus sp. MO_188.B34]MDJ0692867.1 hypothetical protein [Mastigocoleus sp. MO_188.B34]
MITKLKTSFLIFGWAIPTFLLFGLLSYVHSDQFLGNWILHPSEYPLSYTILFWVVFSFSAILNWMLGNIQNTKRLIFILFFIFLGSVFNLIVLLSWLFKLLVPITVFILYMVNIFLISLANNILDLIGVSYTLKEGGGYDVPVFALIAISFLLFFILNKKLNLNTLKEKIILVSLTASVGFLPTIINPLIACIVAERISSSRINPVPIAKRLVLGVPLIVLVTISFVAVVDNYPLPGLIIPPEIRTFYAGNSSYFITEYEYQNALKDVKNCDLIKNEIGEIKSIAIFEGDNYTIMDGLGGPDGNYLHILATGEDKQAFIKGCFSASIGPFCSFRDANIKAEDQNQAKIFSSSEVKKIDISECLQD